MGYLDHITFRAVPVELAKKIGPWEAAFIFRIHQLLEYRRAQDDAHEHDGREWVYTTYDKWKATQFDMLSVRTVRRAFKSLEEKELVLVGEYNKIKTDRTKWYAINYSRLEALMDDSTVQIGHMTGGQSVLMQLSDKDASYLDTPLDTPHDPGTESNDSANGDYEEEQLELDLKSGPELGKWWRMRLKKHEHVKGILPVMTLKDQAQLKQMFKKLGDSAPEKIDAVLANWGHFSKWVHKEYGKQTYSPKNLQKFILLVDPIWEYEPPASFTYDDTEGPSIEETLENLGQMKPQNPELEL